MNLDEIGHRHGDRPLTTPTNPHTQITQNAPKELQDRVREYALSLRGVRPGTSHVSVDGTVAFFLDAPPMKPAITSIFGDEFGHIHPTSDGSLHVNLPTPTANVLIERGWAEYHPLVRKGQLPPVVAMIYGPRDDDELKVVTSIVSLAYEAAGGSEL